jgi:uncharacterized protein with FMN-binding domain
LAAARTATATPGGRDDLAVKRALAALVVTVVAVVLLARYETNPPPRLDAEPARRAEAPAPPQRGVKSGTGPLITTPFSSIQVRAELTRGRLTGVQTLALTGSDAHTRAINARAEPILREEALLAGSAKIDVVSGATYTSESWIESLESAIKDARD